MVKVASLSADLTANTSNFERNLFRARRQMASSGRSMSRNAENFNKRVSTSFRRAAASAAAFQGPLGGIAGRLSGLGAIATSTGVALGGALLALSGAAFTLGKAAQVADRFEGSMNRVNAVLKATAGASAQSAEGIREFSEQLALGTLASVEGVEAAAAKLLTFRRISGDTFKRTLILAQDLAATGFGSLSDNVTQLGKALEDPVRNLGALTRNGVSFSEAQRKVIVSLVETGEAAKAQSIILDALAQQVGGAGAAEGGPIAKGLDVLSQRLDTFFIKLDKASGAGSAFADVLHGLSVTFEGATSLLDPGELPLTEQLKNATEQLRLLQEQATGEIEFLKTRPATADDAEKIVQEALSQQRMLITVIGLRIEEEGLKADAIERTAKVQQDAIQAEFEAAKIEKAREAEQKIFIKAQERKAAAIKSTIDALKAETQAIGLETIAIQNGTMSVEDAAISRQILIRQMQLGVEIGSEEAQQIESLIRKRDQLRNSIEGEVDARKHAARVVAENKSELEKLNEELREFEELRNEGLLSEEEFQRAVERTNEKINDLDESNKSLKKTIESVADSAQDAFADFILGAKSASEAVKQLGLELARTVIKKGTSELFGKVVAAAIGGSFADGGRPPLGKVSLVGEQGPELFVPDRAGTIISNGDIAGMGGGGGLTVFADMRGASVEAVQRLERLVSDLNGSIEPRAVSAVVSENQRNPALLKGV